MAGKNPWWKKIDKSTQHMHETSKKPNIKAQNTCMKQVKNKIKQVNKKRSFWWTISEGR